MKGSLSYFCFDLISQCRMKACLAIRAMKKADDILYNILKDYLKTQCFRSAVPFI